MNWSASPCNFELGARGMLPVCFLSPWGIILSIPRTWLGQPMLQTPRHRYHTSFHLPRHLQFYHWFQYSTRLSWVNDHLHTSNKMIKRSPNCVMSVDKYILFVLWFDIDQWLYFSSRFCWLSVLSEFPSKVFFLDCDTETSLSNSSATHSCSRVRSRPASTWTLYDSAVLRPPNLLHHWPPFLSSTCTALFCFVFTKSTARVVNFFFVRSAWDGFDSFACGYTVRLQRLHSPVHHHLNSQWLLRQFCLFWHVPVKYTSTILYLRLFVSNQ